MDVTLRRKHFDWFLGFQIHFELADSSSIPSTDHRAERKGKKHVQKLKINILQHFILVQILKIGIATKNYYSLPNKSSKSLATPKSEKTQLVCKEKSHCIDRSQV